MNHNGTPEVPAEGDKLMVADLEHFVTLLSGWHARRVAKLEELLTVADGVEVTLDTEAPLILTGDVRRAFVIGLSLGLMELGTLPFSAEVEDVPDVPVQ